MCYGEALSSAVVRARKKHVCDDCGEPIAPGQRYQRNAAKIDGDFNATKLCRTCALVYERDKIPGECTWFNGGESREALRGDPWRETLRWMRETWKQLRGAQ